MSSGATKHDIQVNLRVDKSLTADQQRQLADLINTFLDDESIHGSVKTIRDYPSRHADD